MLAMILTSPFSTQALAQCLTYATPKTDILLLQDAVYAVSSVNIWHQKLIDSGLPIYIFEADLKARGIQFDDYKNIKTIDMSGFVELTEKNVTQITW